MINTSSNIPHLDKTVSPRKQDFLTMAHAKITEKNGSSQSITEYNGGVSLQLDRRTALSVEVVALNKNFSVFFSFVPRLYYILPWQLRLVPEVSLADDEQFQEEVKDLTEEEVAEIETQEA